MIKDKLNKILISVESSVIKMDKIINQELKEYIQEKILPEYDLNDKGHNKEHIDFVLNRAYELSVNHDINYDMLYTVVCYHDIACHINREEHEVLSAQRLFLDENLNKYFDKTQLLLMKEAIEDHRASLEYIPRNIYGKILSSADRKIDVDIYLKSSMSFSLKKNPHISEEELIEDSYFFAIKKFGKNGYAVQKMYIEDVKYKAFLDEIQYLIENKEHFINRAKKVLEEIKNEIM